MKRQQEPDQRPLRAAMGPVSLSTWSFLGGAHLKAIWTDTEPDGVILNVYWMFSVGNRW